jgi:hypothetical protein
VPKVSNETFLFIRLLAERLQREENIDKKCRDESFGKGNTDKGNYHDGRLSGLRSALLEIESIKVVMEER